MAKSPRQNCIDEIQKFAKEKRINLSSEDAAGIVNAIDGLYKKNKKTNPQLSHEALMGVIKKELTSEQIRIARNKIIEAAQVALVDNDLQRYFDSFPRDSKGKALDARNIGALTSDFGIGDSVESATKGFTALFVRDMDKEMRAKNYLKLWRKASPEFMQDVWTEMRRLTGAPDAPSNNKIAMDIASIFYNSLERARKKLNDLGADIRDLEGYVTRQNHDRRRVSNAANIGLPITKRKYIRFGDPRHLQAWKDFTRPILDLERTFPDLQQKLEAEQITREIFEKQIDERLNVIFNQAASGEYLSSTKKQNIGLTGSRNIARGVSVERKLFFKDGPAEFSYFKRFGDIDIYSAVHNTIRYMGQTAAVLEKWGPRPREMFEKYRDLIKDESIKTGALKKAQDIMLKKHDNYFKQVTGEFEQGGSQSVASLSKNITGWIRLTKLGSVFLSQFNDIAVRANSLTHHDIPFSGMIFKSAKDFFVGAKGMDREVADLFQAGIDHLSANWTRRYIDGSFTGWLQRSNEKLQRWQGATYATDNSHAMTAACLSMHLANKSKLGFKELELDSPKLVRELGRFSIGEKEWELLRQTPLKLEDDRSYIGWDNLDLIPDEEFAKYAGDKNPLAIRKAREDLQRKLISYVRTAADTALNMPTDFVTAALNQGLNPGTIPGFINKLVTQLKTYPVNFAYSHLFREYRINQSLRAPRPLEVMDFIRPLSGVARLIASTTIMGTFSIYVGDLVNLKGPREINNEYWYKTLFAGFIRGGGAGIFADFLFGDVNRYGGSALETVAGPGIGMASQFLGGLWALKSLDSAKRDQGADSLANLFNNNIPAGNFWVTKNLLNYMVLYHFQEFMNPGYLRRLQRSVEENSGQTFILSPSQVIQRGGGFK